MLSTNTGDTWVKVKVTFPMRVAGVTFGATAIFTPSKPSPGTVPVMLIQGTVAPGVKPPQNEFTISTSEPPGSSNVWPCDDGLTVALQKPMKKNPWAGIDEGKVASVTCTVKPELGPGD